jgi:hypothetical protein
MYSHLCQLLRSTVIGSSLFFDDGTQVVSESGIRFHISGVEGTTEEQRLMLTL